MVISEGKPKEFKEDLPHCHFGHHETHMKSPGIEKEAPR
jgi:hypothetical protein